MDLKSSYIHMLSEFHSNVYYYEAIQRQSQLVNQVFKISLAVLTAGSVAGWQIWEKLATVWTVIVCTSQVALILYEVLPFKTRFKDIKTLNALLWSLTLSADNHLYDVQQDIINDNQMNDLITEYKKLWKAAEDKFFKDDLVPENEHFKLEAQEKAQVDMKHLLEGK